MDVNDVWQSRFFHNNGNIYKHLKINSSDPIEEIISSYDCQYRKTIANDSALVLTVNIVYKNLVRY